MGHKNKQIAGDLGGLPVFLFLKVITITVINNTILEIGNIITLCYNLLMITTKGVRPLANKKTKAKVPMEHHNMAGFLRGQSSKIITSLSESDKTAFVLKNGKPIAVVMSNERYERLLKAGIDINEY